MSVKHSFSQRMGLHPIKESQINNMDLELRIAIFNFLHNFFVDIIYGQLVDLKLYENIQDFIWRNYFKNPVDENPMELFKNSYIKSHIMKCNWNEVYDLLELIAIYLKNNKYKKFHALYNRVLNSVLKREKAGYQLIEKEIIPITSEQEVKEIDEALKKANGNFGNVYKHLGSALHLLSDRKNPDYRNSIKESISAVEAICRLICGDTSLTLGKALNKIEREEKVKINGKLKSAYSQIYGYTNNEDGVRHALDDEPNLDYEDAKYMLVSCTSFINYLIVKAEKACIFCTEKEVANE